MSSTKGSRSRSSYLLAGRACVRTQPGGRSATFDTGRADWIFVGIAYSACSRRVTRWRNTSIVRLREAMESVQKRRLANERPRRRKRTKVNLPGRLKKVAKSLVLGLLGRQLGTQSTPLSKCLEQGRQGRSDDRGDDHPRNMTDHGKQCCRALIGVGDQSRDAGSDRIGKPAQGMVAVVMH